MRKTYIISTIIILGLALGIKTSFSMPHNDYPIDKNLKNDLYQPVFLDGLFKKGKDKEARRLAEEEKKASMNITDEKSFIALTDIFYEKPFNAEELEFEIRLPKIWRKVPLGMNKSPEFSRKIMSDIARFVGPIVGEHRAKLSLQARDLNHNIDIEHWAKNYFLENGFTLQGDINVESPTVVNANYIYLSGIIAQYVYTKIIFQGNSVIIVRFEIPLSYKDNFAYLQKASVDSFKFINKDDTPIENTKIFSVLDAIRFTYPTSWKLVNPDFKDPDRLKIELHNHDSSNSVTGVLYIIASRKTEGSTLKKEVKKIRTLLELYGDLKTEALLATYDIESNLRFNFSKREEYDIAFKREDRKMEQELWLSLLSDDEWYIFAFMISPKYEKNNYNWARNEIGYTNIVSSIE